MDPDKWEQLCFELIHAENCQVKTVNGHGGDEGIDAYVGSFENPDIIYQFKFFRDSFGTSQVRQIENSLKAALSKRTGFRWILMCSADPTPAAMRSLEALREKNSNIEIKYEFGSEIKARLIETPKVRKLYYPDTQDQLEAICLGENGRPLDMVKNGVRRLNNIVLDDRLRATVTTDGNNVTTVYSVRPGIKEVVPLFKVKSKTELGREALGAFYREGKAFTLSWRDIAFEPLVSLPAALDKCESIFAISTPDQNPASLLLYAGEGGDGGKRQGLLSIFVTLKTTRCGTEVGVRSNEGQAGCPVVIEFEYPVEFGANEGLPELHTTIRPNYEGCTVKSAYRGACFLVKLAETGRLGLCDPNSDPDNISYCSFSGLDTEEIWANQAALFGELSRVCQFFEINPVVDETIWTEEFARALHGFVQRLDMLNGEFEGVASFVPVDANKANLDEVDGREESLFIVDESIWIDLFGRRYVAAVRIVSSGVLSYSVSDGGITCSIRGTHNVYMRALDGAASL